MRPEWKDAAQLVELYPEREPTIVSPPQYAQIQAELGKVTFSNVPFGRSTSYGQYVNRHERRKAAALNRKKR